MIRELYPRFLDCGYSPLLFWQLSTAEVADMLESHHRQQEYKRRRERARMCDMATILDAFGCILLNNLYPGEGGRVIHMQDVLPQLYHQQETDRIRETARSLLTWKFIRRDGCTTHTVLTRAEKERVETMGAITLETLKVVLQAQYAGYQQDMEKVKEATRRVGETVDAEKKKINDSPGIRLRGQGTERN